MMHTKMGDLETPDDEEDLADDDDLELSDDDEADDTIVFSPSKGSDNVGDVSVEINVEELIADFEATADSDAERKKQIRRRLDEIREEKAAMKDLEDTYSFDLNDDD